MSKLTCGGLAPGNTHWACDCFLAERVRTEKRLGAALNALLMIAMDPHVLPAEVASRAIKEIQVIE
jgi:hypothetical protein